MQPNRTPKRRCAAVASVASLALLTTPAVAASAAPTPTDTSATSRAAASSQPALSRINTSKAPSNVRLKHKYHSLLAVHRWYQQYKNGHRVFGAWYAIHRDKVTGAVTVYDGRRKTGKLDTTAPKIGAATAIGKVNRVTKTQPGNVTRREVMVLPATVKTGEARLVWAISTADGRGARTSFVDASSGDLLKTIVTGKKARSDSAKTFTGRGRVFDPNPVVKLQDETLTDRDDSADAVPAAGYTTRLLRRMDDSKTLSGDWVDIVNRDTPRSASRDFTYNRAKKYFEQVNAYYSVDVEQAYLRNLGFKDVNAEAQRVATNSFADDNSFYDPSTDKISLGRGGVDDAEDPEVIWHEYGHAIQDAQVPNFGLSNQAGAIGEGFGDYIAVTMSQLEADSTPVTPTPCVMDWDATSYTSTVPHCLRRTDKDKVYTPRTADSREVHEFGEVWSRALWDMNRSMGRDDATKVVIESQFWMNQYITMPRGAKIMIDVARKMENRGFVKSGAVQGVRRAVRDRQIIG